MRHNKIGRQLGRNSSHRKAMYRNMVTSLFEHGRIQTTDAKAKELRRIAERLITIGKKNDLASKRRAMAFVRSRDVVAKLFDEICPGFGERPGGYTRIIKVGNRRGDNAPISILELVTEDYKPKAKKKAAPKKAAAPKAKAPEVEEKVEEAVEAAPEEAAEETVEAAAEQAEAEEAPAEEAAAEEASAEEEAAEEEEK